MNIIQKQKLFTLDMIRDVFAAYPDKIPELTDNYIHNRHVLNEVYLELLEKYIFDNKYIII